MRTASVSLEHSRSIRFAEGVSRRKREDLEQHLDSTAVVLTVDRGIPQALLTGRVLLTTLRRSAGTLILVDDGTLSGFAAEMEELTAAIDPQRPLRIVRPSEPVPDKAIRVHVGPTAPHRCIRIVPEGHGAHVAGAITATIRLRRPASPLGGVYAAALGADEVFKHTAAVIPNRRVLHRHLRFCPVAISSDLYAALDLPAQMFLDLSIIGLGAIGTGIALLLNLLPAEGRIVAVDWQRFGPENTGTYSIGGVSDVGKWKVDLAAEVLKNFDVLPIHEPVDELIRAIDRREVRWSPTVLTALDSPEARRDAQRLWPDRLIDAATGDTMLGLHDHRHAIDPCMWCVFPVDRQRRSGADAIAEHLGLSSRELADGNSLLTEAHLEGKTDEQTRLLQPHIGKPMCGLARATGLSSLGSDAYMPSIPFVSLQAACLSVGRLIAQHQGIHPRGNLVQYDGLIGPQAATVETIRRKPDCICASRSSAIERARQGRRRSE
jgi:hypothetical protein